jgi:polyphosphate kinase 2 (PPK2 family)
VWSKRYGFINCFEERLAANGTHILKFFLHISPEEQLKRFQQRLDAPMRRWKISEADYSEREYWQEYISAYEDVLNRTSTGPRRGISFPLTIKWFRNLAISEIVVGKLESLGMKFRNPKLLSMQFGVNFTVSK